MIADHLAQCSRYTLLSPRFTPAFEFLKQLDAGRPPGRYELDAGNCFALVQSYTTKPLQDAKFEAHKKFIDIQFILAGRETLLWSPLLELTETLQPYQAENDMAFFAVPPQVTTITLRAGEFAIFFPADGHAPGIDCGAPAEVRKVVVKVRA